MKKFRLISTTCKRCGKEIYTGNKSFYGNNEDKAKYDRICQDCITPEEKHIDC